MIAFRSTTHLALPPPPRLARIARIARSRLAALVLAALWAAAPARAQDSPTAPVRNVDGVPCVGANDFARLLDGVKYGRADVRKLVVRVHDHRFTFTADLPIVLIDDRTVRLDAPVRSLGGELQIPVSVIASLPVDSTVARLVYDAAGARVRRSPPRGAVLAPRIAVAGERTRVTFVAERAAEVVVVSRERAHFRVRVPGTLVDSRRDSLPPGGLVRASRAEEAVSAVVFEFRVDPQTTGYRVLVSGHEVSIEFGRGADLERFAAEGPPGPRALRTVVIDPGHGGDDEGVRSGTLVEKDLALDLARALQAELQRRGVRAVLARGEDRAVVQEDRAQTANREHADVLLALHFDALAGSRAHGATIWCPPSADDPGRGNDSAPGVALVPWRDVARQHAADSHALADALADAFETHSLGPARVRERLCVPLLGVNAPGVVVECAVLSSPDDRARLAEPDGLRAYAAALADGLADYQRHD